MYGLRTYSTHLIFCLLANHFSPILVAVFEDLVKLVLVIAFYVAVVPHDFSQLEVQVEGGLAVGDPRPLLDCGQSDGQDGVG